MQLVSQPTIICLLKMIIHIRVTPLNFYYKQSQDIYSNQVQDHLINFYSKYKSQGHST